MSDVTDDFLNDLGDTEFLKGKSEETQPAKVIQEEKEEKVVSEAIEAIPQAETTDSSPDLMGTDFPAEYIKMVDMAKAQYRLLPSLNYDAIYREIAELSVKSSPTPTLEVLNDELYKVQAAKDRLAEILIDVIKCYNWKKRIVDVLKDAWGKFTLEKNTEGRKGDATFRLSHFLTDFARTEALTKTCDHIFKNLDALQDNLSRRITIWQLILKVREGRMSLPDYDFGKDADSAKTDGLFDDKNEKEDEEGGVQLRDF